MPNRLQGSSSPYLLQHAQNPVDWYPWGPEALEKARQEDKPIFLSIGYSACHWCHVMERESFENPKVAEIMNKLFVNIKVDREERPDIDAIYLKSVILMTGHGGWPTSVWLTPDLKPFYGGTYFPPAPRPGQPSFAQLLLSLAAALRDKREEVLGSAQQLLEAVGRLSEIAALPKVQGNDWLDKAVAVCEAQYDQEFGGFGGAPKFPQAMTLRFLLLQAAARDDRELLEMVEHSAEAMARGGLYDQLGGGFHRYSVDARWLVPHFEKMLYDNALMLGLYADLVAHTGKPLYRWVVESLVGWLGREMKLDHGGFASSTDADSDGGEGKYFVWTPAELEQILEDDERQVFSAFYGVTSSGNFAGAATVLTQNHTTDGLAKALDISADQVSAWLAAARMKTLAARQKRSAPGRDDKALASWNAQTVSALCRAARQAGLEQAKELALSGGRFLQQNFTTACSTGELGRLVAGGQVEGSALGEDVGSLVLAFFDLYELTLDSEWFGLGLDLYDVLLRDFWVEEKALTAMTSSRTSDIPLRPFAFEDNATPSAHSLLLECARRHHRLTGDARSKSVWERAMTSVSALAQRAPTGLGLALQSAALAAQEAHELMLGGAKDDAVTFLTVLQGRFLPNLQIASAATPGLDPELVNGKEAGKAYLCSGFSCQPPIGRADELAAALSSLSPAAAKHS